MSKVARRRILLDNERPRTASYPVLCFDKASCPISNGAGNERERGVVAQLGRQLN
jgi:hypothetical protein